jgi:hypothetical protein
MKENNSIIKLQYPAGTDMLAKNVEWCVLGFVTINEGNGVITITEWEEGSMLRVFDEDMIKELEEGGVKIVEKNW